MWGKKAFIRHSCCLQDLQSRHAKISLIVELYSRTKNLSTLPFTLLDIAHMNDESFASHSLAPTQCCCRGQCYRRFDPYIGKLFNIYLHMMAVLCRGNQRQHVLQRAKYTSFCVSITRCGLNEQKQRWQRNGGNIDRQQSQSMDHDPSSNRYFRNDRLGESFTLVYCVLPFQPMFFVRNVLSLKSISSVNAISSSSSV